MTARDTRQPRCFIAMPISTRTEDAERFGGDAEHWIHVMETIFVPAIEKAGYEAIRPVTQGSHMIHGEIIKHLATAEMVMCDLSSHNPNVFFELGVRTSLNKPVALVRDEHTSLPFDTSGLNTHDYDSTLRGWGVPEQVEKLAKHLRASEASCGGSNPLWRHFGLTITAAQPEPNGSATDAKLELIQEDIHALRRLINSEDKGRLRAEGDPTREPIQEVTTALGQMVGAHSWTVSYDYTESLPTATAEYKPFRARVPAAELDLEAHRFGFEVTSVSATDDTYRISVRELARWG
ncbi:hypothetical protein MicroSTF_09615 [Microbacterium sp. STF-2]|uniref:hypothetical protein n=1 Tax=Microbacterium sp. STF-2 TaxID=3031132 RepID=UPI002AFFD32D|nr:hypothetical protein [Microbacterium sp. STF-2]MEA1263282.1 hypothetical protein [Microbacterium sp. STF-2]